MLQSTHLQSAIGFPPPDGPGQGGAGELIDFALGFLLRQYVVILSLVLLGGVASAIFLVVTPPTYIAQAQILIGTQRPQFIQQPMFADAPIDNAQMESQIQILYSQAILASVVQKLKLAHDPEFASPPVGLIRRLFRVLSNPISAAPEPDATETAIATLANRLTFKRVGFSFLIEIDASSRGPEKSAQIANAVATAYIDDQQEAKRQANRTASTWLQERLQQLGEQNAAAERAVIAFKQQNSIVSAAGKRMDEQNLE